VPRSVRYPRATDARSSSVMPGRDAARSVRNSHPDVLHHSLVFVIQDKTVKDEIADIPAIARAGDDRVAGLDEQRVAPRLIQVGVLRIVRLVVDAHVHVPRNERHPPSTGWRQTERALSAQSGERRFVLLGHRAATQRFQSPQDVRSVGQTAMVAFDELFFSARQELLE
jgi:hypothetical protein